jgi:hypothetical protein
MPLVRRLEGFRTGLAGSHDRQRAKITEGVRRRNAVGAAVVLAVADRSHKVKEDGSLPKSRMRKASQPFDNTVSVAVFKAGGEVLELTV